MVDNKENSLAKLTGADLAPFTTGAIGNRVKKIERAGDSLRRLIEPKDPLKRALLRVANYNGVTRALVRPFVESDSAAQLRGKFVEELLDLRADVTQMVPVAKRIVDEHQRILNLRDQVKQDPENEVLAEALKSRLRQAVHSDFALDLDPEIQMAIAEFAQPDSPEKRMLETQSTLREADDRLSLTAPIVAVVQASTLATVALFESLKGEFGHLLAISPALEKLDQNTSHITSAVQVPGIAREAIIRQLEIAVEASRLALEVAVSAGSQDDASKKRIRETEAAAKSILADLKRP